MHNKEKSYMYYTILFIVTLLQIIFGCMTFEFVLIMSKFVIKMKNVTSFNDQMGSKKRSYYINVVRTLKNFNVKDQKIGYKKCL